MVIFGISHRKGEFNGQQYDNFMLSCLRDSDPTKDEEGQIAEILKVSKDVFLSSNITVGDEVCPLYDKYGRIVKL